MVFVGVILMYWKRCHHSQWWYWGAEINNILMKIVIHGTSVVAVIAIAFVKIIEIIVVVLMIVFFITFVIG